MGFVSFKEIKAESIRTIGPVTPLICTISCVIDKPDVRIACAIGIGYQHDGSMRILKLT